MTAVTDYSRTAGSLVEGEIINDTRSYDRIRITEAVHGYDHVDVTGTLVGTGQEVHVRFNRDDKVTVRWEVGWKPLNGCETHDKPGSCTQECVDLLYALQAGGYDFGYDPEGVRGPEKTVQTEYRVIDGTVSVRYVTDWYTGHRTVEEV